MVPHSHGKPTYITSRKPGPSDIVPVVSEASMQEKDARFDGAFHRIRDVTQGKALRSQTTVVIGILDGILLIDLRDVRIRMPKA